METTNICIPRLVAEYIDEPVGLCTADKTIDALDLDSLDVVELGLEIEDYYDIEIPNEAYAKVKTIQDLINVVDCYVPKELCQKTI